MTGAAVDPDRRAFAWVRLIAIVAFAAGLIVGLAAPSAFAAIRGPTAAIDPDESFVREIASRYDLSRDQIRTLRMVLASAWADTKDALRAKREDLPPEVTRVQNRTDARIRALLTADQRTRYDRDRTQDPPQTDR